MLIIVSETLITPEVFSEVLCDDLDLPLASFVPAISQAIRQQVKQFAAEPDIVLDDQIDQRVVMKVKSALHSLLFVSVSPVY